MTPSQNLDGLQTEARNPRTWSIDTAATEELCRIINREDSTIPSVVEACIPTIASAIDTLTTRVRSGGRIFYIGAGTSGRLGVLDASEIPPTFSASPEQWVALIAGGDGALRNAKEGAEDSPDAAAADLSARKLNSRDCLIGIATSGRTPYVLGGLKYAKRIGCVTVGVACAAPSAMGDSGNVDFMIAAVTGPEAVTGSTRMKAGTATKLVLNMISTGVMIRLGKTYGNVMIDLKPTNIKLRLRARGMLRGICGRQCPKLDEEIDSVLEECGNSVKLAAAKLRLQCSTEEAAKQLLEVDGILARLWEISGARLTDGAQKGTRSRPGYVLCIDGGGSKCRAVIQDDNGIRGVGEAGPCNPSDIGVGAAVTAMNVAIHRAIASCFAGSTSAADEVPFVHVWIGVAGIDREPVKGSIRQEMLALLGRRLDTTLTITNDIEMMATAAGHRLGVEDVIVLVAGTGSVAMRYRKENNRFRRIGRSGGWGPLLGDDGSGFDIGRHGLRVCLEVLESSEGEEDGLVGRMMAHLQSHPGGDEARDLLSSILSAQPGESHGVAQTRKRMASCAPVVLASVESDWRARDIVQAALRSLVTLLSRICRGAETDESGAHLVLAGGLMQCESFREELQGLVHANLASHIGSVEHVDDPAAMGADCLAQQIWREDAP